jgi:hypothetical protein
VLTIGMIHNSSMLYVYTRGTYYIERFRIHLVLNGLYIHNVDEAKWLFDN